MKYTFEEFKQAMEKSHATRQDFLKTLLTIASAMLAILASFHSNASTATTIQYILFLTTLISLSLGILTGGICLYYDTVSAKSLFRQVKEEILKQLNDSGAPSGIVAYDPPKLFYICEKICYICLLIAVISIALYTGFSI